MLSEEEEDERRSSQDGGTLESPISLPSPDTVSMTTIGDNNGNQDTVDNAPTAEETISSFMFQRFSSLDLSR